MEFLKLFGVVLLFACPMCTVQGMIPSPIGIGATVALLGLAIHHHRNRSLL